jgi:hypothetical protein
VKSPLTPELPVSVDAESSLSVESPLSAEQTVITEESLTVESSFAEEQSFLMQQSLITDPLPLDSLLRDSLPADLLMLSQSSPSANLAQLTHEEFITEMELSPPADLSTPQALHEEFMTRMDLQLPLITILIQSPCSLLAEHDEEPVSQISIIEAILYNLLRLPDYWTI